MSKDTAVTPRAHTLEGTHHVRVFYPAWADSAKVCRSSKDVFELRAQALKLRYWPEKNPEDDHGQLLDINWDWIKSLKGQRVGELRIGDTINGNDNLRVIFYVGDSKRPDTNSNKPIIWILRVMQKKRNGFTKFDIQIFEARRKLVDERFYKFYDTERGRG